MALEVVAWNICNGFSDGNRAPQLIETIAHDLKPDIAILPEAYFEGSDDRLDNVTEDFDVLGYRVKHHLYEDVDGRRDRHGLMLIGRHELMGHVELIRLAGRTAFKASVADPTSDREGDFFGVHLDDRSKYTRALQTDDLLTHVVDRRPTIVAGDDNDMHARGLRTRILRAATRPLCALPLIEPGTPMPANMKSLAGLEYVAGRIGSLGSRLHEATSGVVMQRLEAAQFRDADESRRPTMSNRLPLAQLDHIMVRDAVPTGSRTRRNRLSDHRIVSARVTF
ncbi:MAG TPA: endonuclease/exonuclease/phosphatase family protein [Candidatus Saccharimonadales bacterium]|jgi:endonuclease/exonuclease/phosphatase family metal-dependent hydrolase|nr:endonuclease/exonuclease/phosphatase family protein [Candidatus Saccharimonadales bacterium]